MNLDREVTRNISQLIDHEDLADIFLSDRELQILNQYRQLMDQQLEDASFFYLGGLIPFEMEETIHTNIIRQIPGIGRILDKWDLLVIQLEIDSKKGLMQ